MPEYDSTVRYTDVPGFPGYKVGTDGTVWSCRERGTAGMSYKWRILKGHLLKSTGYVMVDLCLDKIKHHRLVHRLVLEAFVGPCPLGMVCRHFPDRNPANNRLDNLQWGTHQENQMDRFVHGTDGSGQKNPISKFSNREAEIIRARQQAGESMASIARQHGVTRQCIYLIVHRKTYV
jgi:HNH endonuclease